MNNVARTYTPNQPLGTPQAVQFAGISGVMTPSAQLSQQNADRDPSHTHAIQVTHSSIYARLLAGAFLMRYMLRAMVDRLQKSHPDLLDERADKLFDTCKAEIKSDATSFTTETRKELLRSGIFKPDEHFTELKEILPKGDKKTVKFNDFKKTIEKNGVGAHLERYYARAMGIGAAGITLSHANRTMNEIKELLGETIAYENGKDPKDITYWSDVRHSDNKIVQNMTHNFTCKNARRLGVNALFFANELGRIDFPALHTMRIGKFNVGDFIHTLSAFNMGDFALGAEGALLFFEANRDKSTLFEDISDLAARKINPISGLADSITPGNIIDIYQKYSMEVHHELAFKDATIFQDKDHNNWPEAEKIFTRISDLMNQSYKYKHSSRMDLPEEERAKLPLANFTLPKFLYMLGHDMIDTHHPQETIARIDVANQLGIDSLKAFDKLLKEGKPLAEAQEIYPVLSDKTSHARPVSTIRVPSASPYACTALHTGNHIITTAGYQLEQPGRIYAAANAPAYTESAGWQSRHAANENHVKNVNQRQKQPDNQHPIAL